MTVRTLHRPTHREALAQLEAAFDSGDLITVFGRCTVEYEGRAASSLGPGDRLLLLKPDGSALVHTDEQRTPVNWQPPGCEHRGAVRDGRLVVRSERTTPSESLTVRFERVAQFSAYDVTDDEELSLLGSEEDLRQHVLDEPDLIESGFQPLATERESAAGAMDVYGEDSDGTPLVVELKRRRVGPDAVGQLQRYVDALEREFGDGAEVRGVLVAPSVTDRAADLLETEGLEHVALDPDTGQPPESDGAPEGDSDNAPEEESGNTPEGNSDDATEGNSGDPPTTEASTAETGSDGTDC